MKEKWAKIKEFFSHPKVIKWTVIILTVVIVVGALKALVWTIYTKDKPAFVPEEVREDIQGAIKEAGEEIKKVSKPVGSFIVDSGYVEEDDCDCLEPTEEDLKSQDPTLGWPTYTSAELGISFKYPEGWIVSPGSALIKVLTPEYEEAEAEHPMILLRKYSNDGLGLEEWLNKNSDKFIGDQATSDVPGFTERTQGTVEGKRILTFTYTSMGEIKTTLVEIGESIVVLENIMLSDSATAESEDAYEGILSTIN